MASVANQNVPVSTTEYCDPVIEAYKKDIDRTLLRENLKLTVAERFEKFQGFMKFIYGLKQAGSKARRMS